MSNTTHAYEAMFLLNPVAAATDWNAVTAEIQKVMKKNKAEVVSLDRWGERKLTYTIRHQSRGVYALAYFTSSPEAAAAIKADFVLSEAVMRVLILLIEGEIKKREVPRDFERLEGAPEPVTTGGHGRY